MIYRQIFILLKSTPYILGYCEMKWEIKSREKGIIFIVFTLYFPVYISSTALSHDVPTFIDFFVLFVLVQRVCPDGRVVLDVSTDCSLSLTWHMSWVGQWFSLGTLVSCPISNCERKEVNECLWYLFDKILFWKLLVENEVSYSFLPNFYCFIYFLTFLFV